MVSAMETMGPRGGGGGVVREDPGGTGGSGDEAPKGSEPRGCKEQGGRRSLRQRPAALHAAGTRSTKSPACTWAATVWDLVGKSFVTQAVLNPASERPNAARKPAPPAPTTTASNS